MAPAITIFALMIEIGRSLRFCSMFAFSGVQVEQPEKALRNISNPAMSQLAQRLDLFSSPEVGEIAFRLETWCKLQDSCSQAYLRPRQRLL